jgi:hypothetical protein
MKKSGFLLMVGIFILAGNSFATEGGGGVYPNGNENYMSGALPPPGFHMLIYAGYYGADTVRDQNGDRAPLPNFKLDVFAISPRFVWVFDTTSILRGDLVVHLILPFLNVNLDLTDPAGHRARQSKTGLGGYVFGTGYGYHVNENFHFVAALDINAPTGDWRNGDPVNLDRGYWNFEPLICLTYVQPEGINADLKIMWDFNLENPRSNITSGMEFHMDWAVGWGVGKGFVLGLGGYIYQQVTNDTINGNTWTDPFGGNEGNKGRAFAIGPSIKYDNGKGFFITAKYSKEFAVANRAQGWNLNIKMALPF